MSYSIENGYTPRNYDEILENCVNVVNEQFETDYTPQTFVGTNLWKYFYGFIQEIMTVENNIAMLSVKLQDYIRTQNEELIIPRSSPDGIVQALEDELGLIASVKPTELADAGYIYLAVDVDNTAEDYAETKDKIFKVLAKYMGAGLFYVGSETGYVTEKNGQQFQYAYSLPTETALQVKIQVKISDNTTEFIETPTKIKERFLENFNKMYRLGYDFEPDIYLCRDDLNFASEIKISYLDDGDYTSDIYQATYDEKIVITPENVEVEVL